MQLCRLNLLFFCHLRKPSVLSSLRSLCVRNEVGLVPLACEDNVLHATDIALFKQYFFRISKHL